MRLIAFMIVFHSTLCVHAQTDSIVRLWAGTAETNIPALAISRASYYFKDGMWKVESRYMPNGNLYMTGSYKDKEATIKQGEFTWYHDNGKPSGNGTYVNNKLEGLWKSWHKNGRLKDSIFYKDNYPAGKGRSWDEKGQLSAIYELDGNGSGPVKFYNGRDTLDSEGVYSGGQKKGNWIYYAPEGYKEWTVVYEKDSVLSARCFNKSGSVQENCIFEKEAYPEGGATAWKAYLGRAIGQAFERTGYPSKKLMKSKVPISGQVWVRFLVEKDGSISDIVILRSLNREADDIVKHVMRNAPRWVPAMVKNKLMRSYHTQPVTFDVTIEE